MSETLEHNGIKYQQDGKEFVVYLGGEEKRFDTEHKVKSAITRYKKEFEAQAKEAAKDDPPPDTEPEPEPDEDEDEVEKPGKKVEIVLVTQEGQTTKICGIQFKKGRAKVPESKAQDLIERLPKVFGYPTRE